MTMFYGTHLDVREVSTKVDPPRCQTCGTRPSVEVFDAAERSHGCFCLSCGYLKLKALVALERTNPEMFRLSGRLP
jgi:hypothetical protein